MALTFFQEGWGAMNSAFTVMNTQFAAKPCFKGNAAFDYDDVILLGP